MNYFVAAFGLQRRPNRAVRELQPTCRGCARYSAVWAEGIPRVSVALRWRLEEPTVDQSSLLPH